MSTKEIHARIEDYLGNGGLFNPEMMEHDKVRNLILDARNELSRMREMLVRADVALETCRVGKDAPVRRNIAHTLYGTPPGLPDTSDADKWAPV